MSAPALWSRRSRSAIKTGSSHRSRIFVRASIRARSIARSLRVSSNAGRLTALTPTVQHCSRKLKEPWPLQLLSSGTGRVGRCLFSATLRPRRNPPAPRRSNPGRHSMCCATRRNCSVIMSADTRSTATPDISIPGNTTPSRRRVRPPNQAVSSSRASSPLWRSGFRKRIPSRSGFSHSRISPVLWKSPPGTRRGRRMRCSLPQAMPSPPRCACPAGTNWFAPQPHRFQH